MRVLITRPREQADTFADALRAAGMEPVFFPTIQIAPAKDPTPLDDALKRLEDFSWIIFTSANAVEAVWKRLEILQQTFSPKIRVAAVGPKTAASLKTRGLIPHFVPDEYIAEAILPGLGDVWGQHILLPLADLAHDTLPNALKQAGAHPHLVTAYHTLPANPDPEGLTALRAGVDVITFTSGSTVRNFIALTRAAELDPFALPNHPQIACLGPKTAAAAREAGFQVEVVAEAYTVERLVEALGKQVDKVHRETR
ncbi:MAG: hypothetical protein Fur0022_42750 [Anaerolineales bacterium]